MCPQPNDFYYFDVVQDLIYKPMLNIRPRSQALPGNVLFTRLRLL